MHVQVDEDKLAAAACEHTTINTTQEDKENAGDKLNTQSHATQPLTLPQQYSNRSIAKMIRATAQHAQHTSVHALLTPRDGEDHSDTAAAAAAANEAVYISLLPASPRGLLTPRDNLKSRTRKAEAKGAVGVGGVGGNTSPGWLSCWSSLSSPEQLHMHTIHAGELSNRGVQKGDGQVAGHQAAHSTPEVRNLYDSP